MNTVQPLIRAATGAALAWTFACGAMTGDKEQLQATASKTLSEFSASNVTQYELTQKAAGILVFPRIAKSGGSGGVPTDYGEGILMVGGKNNGFYKLTGGSVGTTPPAPEHSEIVLFMTAEALRRFVSANVWTVGIDADVAFATKVAGGAYNSETLKKPIIAFAFGEHGFIADMSLAGAQISRLLA
jgi:lipid-binding SYLF domain-containing protein